MKTYVVLESSWDCVNVLYCGLDETEASRILEDGMYAQNNTMEVWENGEQIGTKNGTYKPREDD